MCARGDRIILQGDFGQDLVFPAYQRIIHDNIFPIPTPPHHEFLSSRQIGLLGESSSQIELFNWSERHFWGYANETEWYQYTQKIKKLVFMTEHMEMRPSKLDLTFVGVTWQFTLLAIAFFDC